MSEEIDGMESQDVYIEFKEMACDDPETNWKKGDVEFCKKKCLFFPNVKHDIDMSFLESRYGGNTVLKLFPCKRLEDSGLFLCPSQGFNVKGGENDSILTRVRFWKIGYEREGKKEFSCFDSEWMDDIMKEVVAAMKRIGLSSILYFMETPMLYAKYDNMENEAKFEYYIKGSKSVPKEPIPYDYE